MKWKRTLLALLMCLCLVCSVAFSFRANADFGDFSGDSDYGGSDSDWGSNDNDYSSGNDHYYVSGGSSDGSGGDGISIVVAIVIVIILVAIFSKKGGGKGGNGGGGSKPVAPGAKRTDDSQLKKMSEYTQLDPGFDAPELTQRLSNWYVQMQNTWSAGDISSVRPFFEDAYFAQMERQLQQMKQAGRTDHTERIAVLGVELRGFYQSGGLDHIVAELRTRIVSYVTDRDGKVISGSQTAEKFMTYEWNLTRPSGTKTQGKAEMNVVNCPNCGATVNINATAKCPYCDSVITVNQHDWVISSIKGISQRTGN